MLIGGFGLFPLEYLVDLDLHVVAFDTLLPFIEVEILLNRVLLRLVLTLTLRICVALLGYLHVADNKVEADFILKGPQAYGVEIDIFVSHVLKDAILGQIVVIPQTKLEKGHIFLFRFCLVSQLVMQKAAKEFDVALLGVDRESFAIFGARSIVMRDCIVMGFEHAQID